MDGVGRFQTDGKDLIIHCVSRMDKNRTVSCKAMEERGLTAFADTILPVTCKFCFALNFEIYSSVS